MLTLSKLKLGIYSLNEIHNLQSREARSQRKRRFPITKILRLITKSTAAWPCLRNILKLLPEKPQVLSKVFPKHTNLIRISLNHLGAVRLNTVIKAIIQSLEKV